MFHINVLFIMLLLNNYCYYRVCSWISTLCHVLCAVKCDTTDGLACRFPWYDPPMTQTGKKYNGCRLSVTEPTPGQKIVEPWCRTKEFGYCAAVGKRCRWGYCQPGCASHDGMNTYVLLFNLNGAICYRFILMQYAL